MFEIVTFHFPLVLLLLLLLSLTTVQNWSYSNGGQIAWDTQCLFNFTTIELLSETASTWEVCGDLCLANSQCTNLFWDNTCFITKLTDSIPYHEPSLPSGTRCGFVTNDVTTTTMATTTTAATTTTLATTATLATTTAPSILVTTIAALTAAAAVVAIAVGVAVSVGSAGSVGSPLAASALQSFNQANQIQGQVAQFLLSGGRGVFNSQTPVNDFTLPVLGSDQQDDGCGDSSVRFQDGKCYPVLNRGSCSNPYNWITVDPVSLAGQCSPRLCGKGRVFSGADGLCHDSEDPFVCRGRRKQYYTAYGDPICDCPVGQYPFPTDQDECVTLFTKGPCPIGQVVTISRTGTILCAPSKCQFNANRPLARYKDGFCYSLGSQGPCRSQEPLQLFGYDVFQRKTLCVNVTTSDSPYFASEQEEAFMDTTFNHLLPEYDDFRVFLVTDNQNRAGKRNWKTASFRRQGGNTAGLFRLGLPLLNPCRPGSRNGNNYKCTNPLVFRGRKLKVLQSVRPAFECPGDSILQATGQCGNDTKRASCGPSYQYIEATGQCQTLFQSEQ